MAQNNLLQSSREATISARTLPNRVDESPELAAGRDFMTVGKLQRALLRSLGLAPTDFVVEVGCGSGRLALQLSAMLHLRYLGMEPAPELLNDARKLCQREDWSFVAASGPEIPCPSGLASFVCFFSVFTHLTHENAFHYLRDASRVLRPGGRIVFSFLTTRRSFGWDSLAISAEVPRPQARLDRFINRQDISAWSSQLGLNVDLIEDGDKPHIPLEDDLAWHDGRVMHRSGNLGHSVAVLSRPVHRGAHSAESTGHRLTSLGHAVPGTLSKSTARTSRR